MARVDFDGGGLSTEGALARLAALAHTHRLTMLKTLARPGSSGCTLDELASMLALGPSCTAFHLGRLEACGPVRSLRQDPDVFYHVLSKGVRQLVGCLLGGCCAGDAIACLPEPSERVTSEEINP